MGLRTLLQPPVGESGRSLTYARWVLGVYLPALFLLPLAVFLAARSTLALGLSAYLGLVVSSTLCFLILAGAILLQATMPRWRARRLAELALVACVFAGLAWFIGSLVSDGPLSQGSLIVTYLWALLLGATLADFLRRVSDFASGWWINTALPLLFALGQSAAIDAYTSALGSGSGWAIFSVWTLLYAALLLASLTLVWFLFRRTWPPTAVLGQANRQGLIGYPGIILFVADYPACRRFYAEVLRLPIVAEKSWEGGGLTAFAWSTAYLMIESGGSAARTPDADSTAYHRGQPFILRLDLTAADLETTVARLQAVGVEVERRGYPWGEIAVFFDPNGTRLEIKTPMTGSKA
ncbi:MAG: VOC family protein [Kiloniellales bacterium]